jgi:hypothetical protein
MKNIEKYLELTDYATRQYWEIRTTAADKQGNTSGIRDQGERSAVTAGNHLDGFEHLCREILSDATEGKCAFHIGKSAPTLPGFFRPTKCWDIVATIDEKLIAVIEFKSQAGPSFGNNFNNRTEEALGSAHDFWTAYREGAFGKQNRPFLGWIMLLEDCDKSNQPVKVNSPIYPSFSEFENASYARRYDLLCSKLIQENLYTHAALITSRRGGSKAGFISEQTSVTSFIKVLYGAAMGF